MNERRVILTHNCRKFTSFIKRLMEKRRRLKRPNCENLEYKEICKLIKRVMQEWFDQRTVDSAADALKRVTKLKQQSRIKEVIVSLNDKEGYEI